jgi:hypothetical protein
LYQPIELLGQHANRVLAALEPGLFSLRVNMGSQQIVSGLDDLQGLSKVMAHEAKKSCLKIVGPCGAIYPESAWCRGWTFKDTHDDSSLYGTSAAGKRPESCF